MESKKNNFLFLFSRVQRTVIPVHRIGLGTPLVLSNMFRGDLDQIALTIGVQSTRSWSNDTVKAK